MMFSLCKRLGTLALLAATASMLLPAARAEKGKAASSLGMVPADAAFYNAMLRNRQQFDAVAKSKAWTKLKSLPVYQMAMNQIQQQLAKPDPQLAQLLKMYEAAENKELMGLLCDMMSEEVFLYGGESIGTTLELFTRINAGNRFGQLALLMRPAGGNANPAVAQARVILNLLQENSKLIQTPELVLGFKIADAKVAESQLKRLEEFLEPLAEQVPLLKGRLKKIKVRGQTFLSLALDGKMIPWDRIPVKDIEEKEGEYDALVEKLQGLKLSVSIGVRDDYLLLAFGESLDSLDRLGGKGQKLADRAELKPLAGFAEKPVTSIGYASKSLLARMMTTPEDVDGLAATLKGLLGNAPLPEAQRKRIANDIDGMAKDFKAVLPEPGAFFSFSFLTDNGEESYAYNWIKPVEKSEAAPLTLLDHLGGDPIFAWIGRSQSDPKRYSTTVKWLKVLHGHVEEFALGQLPEGPKEMYQQFGKTFYPLLKRLDEINAKMLLPALADGQTAVVMDGKWKSKRWHAAAPETPEALPLPEFALVMGVSDRDLLVKAMTEYRKLFNETLVAVREMSKGQVPEIQVPAPETEKVRIGELYYYPLPANVGLDKQVVPTAGLGGKVAVLALSRQHAQRLLSPKALTIPSGPLADAKRPLLGAIYFDWPALIDTASPWIEFGVALAMPPARKEPKTKVKPGVPTPEEILEQVRTVLEVLKVYKGSTSAIYHEGGATVTHSESVIKDLK